MLLDLAIIIMLWVISLFIAFEVGRKHKKPPRRTAAEPTADDKAIKRANKELANMLNYNGEPQEKIYDAEL